MCTIWEYNGGHPSLTHRFEPAVSPGFSRADSTRIPPGARHDPENRMGVAQRGGPEECSAAGAGTEVTFADLQHPLVQGVARALDVLLREIAGRGGRGAGGGGGTGPLGGFRCGCGGSYRRLGQRLGGDARRVRTGGRAAGGGRKRLAGLSVTPNTNGPPPPPRVTFRRVVVSLRGPGQSPVLPFACCVGSLRSVGRCGRCSCWCRFRIRGAQCPPPPPRPPSAVGCGC